MTHEFSWFDRNNSSIKDLINLSKEMNSTGLIMPQNKFQVHPMKGERKHSFLASSYSIMKYETLASSIF